MNLIKKIKKLTVWNPIVFSYYGNYLTSHSNVMTRCFNFGINATYALYTRIKRSTTSEREIAPIPKEEFFPKADRLISKNILIIAELSIPQCNQYRVYPKLKYFEKLGFNCEVVSWREIPNVLEKMQLSTLLILYRVPFTDDVQKIYKEAQRLSLPTIYDIDDLVFHPVLYANYLKTLALPDEVKNDLLHGAELYKQALQKSDYCILSTKKLEEIAREMGKKTALLPNGITDELESVSFFKKNKPDNHLEVIKIFYGSGSNTHDADINSIAQDLLKILSKYKNTELYLLGELNFGKVNDQNITSRIHRIPRLSIQAYYSFVSTMDISVIPLTKDTFTECKSNIKFIESSWFKVPSVVCDLPEFSNKVKDGENGFIAFDSRDWALKIGRLIEDSDLRQQMGEKAHRSVLEDYGQERLTAAFANIVSNDFRLLTLGDNLPDNVVLTVNIFCGVSSFGGATVVAEGIAEELAKTQNVNSYAFSTHFDPNDEIGSIRRYLWKGVCVFSVNTPINTNLLNNDVVTKAFSRVIDTVKPKIVHIHAVQGFAEGIIKICNREKINYFVTLHDFSWLCPRLFMCKEDGGQCGLVMPDAVFCHQTCNYEYELILKKRALAANCFSNAKAIYVPSAYMQGFVNKNWNINVRVNKNGITIKKSNRQKVAKKELHFGFVAGKHPVKGYDLIRGVFNKLKLSNWKLHIIYGGDAQDVKHDFVGLEDQIVVEPPIAHDRMVDFYSHIDVLLFPSLVNETFGLTVREAIISDCFVIVSNCGGPTEAVNFENGIIIESGSFHALYKAVSQLLNKAEEISSYKTKNYGDIRTIQQQAEQLLSDYKKLVLDKYTRCEDSVSVVEGEL